MSTSEERGDHVIEIREFVKSGAITTASRSILTQYSTWLCNSGARSFFLVESMSKFASW
jgi:hypothetical protein